MLHVEETEEDRKEINKKDNKEKNLDRNNQELDILRQISFEEYMKKTKNEPWYFGCCIFCRDCCCVCCCICCCYYCCFCFAFYSIWCNWSYDHIDKFYKNVQINKTCDDILISILSILSLIYNIYALFISILLHQVLKDLKNKPIEYEALYEDLPITNDHSKYLKDIEHDQYVLMYTLSKMEIGFLITNIIIFISFIIFYFLLRCKFHDIIIKTEKKIGKITQAIILIICIFYVLFAIIFFFTVYLFAYSNYYFYTYYWTDYETIQPLLMFYKMGFYFFIIVNIYMIFYYFEFLLSLYLDLNFEQYINEKENNSNGRNNINEITNDIDNINDKIKIGYLFIGKKNIPITIKTNKNIYLEEPNKKKIYKFKRIKLNNIKEDFVYIKVKNNAYGNMLASSDWIFPGKEKFYEKVYDIEKIFGFFIILFSIPLVFLANNNEAYNNLRFLFKMEYLNVKYKNIFIIYGDYEKSFTIIRFIIYIIVFLIFIAILFKRIFYGGYMIYKLLKKANILLHLLNILNVIIFILHCILWIFSFICKDIESKLEKYIFARYHVAISFQKYYTIFCLLYMIYAFIKINALRKYIVMILTDLDNLGKEEKEEKKESEIKFQGLDSNIYFLKEIKIQGHPRYLYYNFKLVDENNVAIVYNKEKELNDDDLDYSISYYK